MTKMFAITAQVDDRVADGLDRLAARSGRDAALIAAQALGRYVDEQEAFWRSLDEAEADIDAGRFYTQEQMEAWFVERRGRPAAG